MRRWPSRLLFCALLGGALLAAACEDTNGTPLPDGQTTAEGIDREAILNDVAQVRTLLDDAASDFPVEVVSNVEFNDGQLTVTVTEDVTGLEDAEALCDDLSQAVAATDVEIMVVDGSGAPLATCGFQA